MTQHIFFDMGGGLDEFCRKIFSVMVEVRLHDFGGRIRRTFGGEKQLVLKKGGKLRFFRL